ncbi:RNA 2',3'-cyclic phosphodiesterase [bacterium HR32]|nr:RNA 2',3'-cyclic phosphodiesterase [bacterium HR32]
MAVNLDPALRAAVEAVRRRLVEAWPHGERLVKWVEPENLHLTLKFLGEVGEGKAVDVLTALEGLAGRGEFYVRYAGLGAFPRARGARVLWIGVTEGADRLASLAAWVEDRLRPLGFPPEERPFSPHLTIGRLRTPAYHPELQRAVEREARVEVGSQRVQSVEVMESVLRRQGPVYTVRASYRLGGPGA